MAQLSWWRVRCALQDHRKPKTAVFSTEYYIHAERSTTAHDEGEEAFRELVSDRFSGSCGDVKVEVKAVGAPPDGLLLQAVACCRLV